MTQYGQSVATTMVQDNSTKKYRKKSVRGTSQASPRVGRGGCHKQALPPDVDRFFVASFHFSCY